MSGDGYSDVSEHEGSSGADMLMIRLEDLAGKHCRGGLAVGSADANEFCSSVAITVAKLYFTDDLYPSCECFLNERTEDGDNG